MKKYHFILASIVALGVLVCSVARTNAQGTKNETQSVSQGTKIAVVNVKIVFEKYERRQSFVNDVERTIQPYKDKLKVAREDVAEWEADLRKPTIDAKDKARLEAAIRKKKYEIEETNIEATRIVAEKSRVYMADTSKAVNEGIKAVAEAYGFQIVLGYGEPDRVEFSDQSRDPKKVALDMGTVTPLYIHDSVDITDHVVRALRFHTPRAKTKEANP